ncbi:MAG: hypothetical protein ABSG19_13750 [Candidatus Aminicenantales bacterium]
MPKSRSAKSESAALRKAWNEWMAYQISKGSGEEEATVTANVTALCRALGMDPRDWGLVNLETGRIRATFKTTRIVVQLLIAVLGQEIENPPNLDGLLNEPAEIPMVEYQLPA